MTSYLYRGTSLSAANEEEFGDGRIHGFEANIYRGEFQPEGLHSTIARGTPLDDLPWRRPDPDMTPYLEEDQGVTGGLTNVIGTAIGFSTGIPLVLYLRESSLNGGGRPIRYGYEWFNATPGALAWVYGTSVSGEIRGVNEGLLGLTTMTESGPQVWEWGKRDLDGAGMAYEDEREVLVMDDDIRVAGSMESVALMLEGRRTPTQALATFDGYHAGFGDDGVDTSRWPARQVLETVYDEMHAKAEVSLPDLWIVNLSTSIMGSMPRIPEEAFDFAYNGRAVIEDYDAVPDHILGRD